VDCGTAAVTQIVDPCECYQHGLSVSPYYSAAKNRCVYPEHWTNVLEYQGAPQSWSSLAPPTVVGHIATGEPSGTCLDPTCANLVVLNQGGSDGYRYNGISNSWDSLNLPTGVGFAQASVGEGWILGLTKDASTVYRWDVLTQTWTQAPAPTGHIFTGIASGRFDIATDETGTPWELVNGHWVSVGTPGDQFVVGGDWAAKLSPTHLSIKIWPGTGSWIDTHHSGGSELFIGGPMMLASRDLVNPETLSAMATTFSGGVYTPGPWSQIYFGASTDVALYDGADPIVRLPVDQSPGPQQDVDPLGSGYSWQYIGPSVKHIYGHSQHLFATQGLVF
jgi:hypothetical protein